MKKNKIIIDSLFSAGGTLSEKDIDNAIKVPLNYKKTELSLFIVKNNYIHGIKDNKVYTKKLVFDAEFSYKIQKTQVKSNDIERILNSDTWGHIFANKFFEL